MNPNTGEIIPTEELQKLSEINPERAAKFSVEIVGPEEDVRRISDAVKRAANRRRNKAARKARKKSR